MLSSYDVAEIYDIKKFTTQGQICIHFLKDCIEKHDFLKEPHRYSCYIILYFEQKSGEILIDNERINSKKSCFHCIKPNSILSLKLNKKPSGLFIAFSDTFFSLRYNDNQLSYFQFLYRNPATSCFLPSNRKPKWDYLIQCLLEEQAEVNVWTENILRSYLNIVLHELERNLNPTKLTSFQSNKEQKLIQFERLLEEKYNFRKGPSYYANALHISTNYLNKLCREYRHTTSGEIIRNRLRLEAERYLHYSPLSVSEIAYKLGFESSSYFVTFFKQKNKLTPEQFRKQQFKNKKTNII